MQKSYEVFLVFLTISHTLYQIIVHLDTLTEHSRELLWKELDFD